jgi:hypothetical protein
MHGLDNEKGKNENYIENDCTKLLSKWQHKSEDSEV